MKMKQAKALLILSSLLFLATQLIALEKVDFKPIPSKADKTVVAAAALKSAFDRSLLDSPWSNWGISTIGNSASINLEDAWKHFQKKKDITVAVIDTGIDPNHPFLKNNLHTFEGKTSSQNYGKDFSKRALNINQPSDSHGHGTHVAGIIKSIFPDVKIVALKYYNKDASGQDNLNSTIEALKYAVDHNVDVINYSGGGPEPALEELRILKEAERKGILVIAAAGNEQSNIDEKSHAYYPASYKLQNIVTVGAYDQDVKMIALSNFGKDSVDIFAPGFRIRSTYPEGRAGYLSGTSQATAFVTGVAALVKAKYPSLSTTQIKSIIRESASKVAEFKGKAVSEGKLNAASALELAEKMAEGRTVANANYVEIPRIVYRAKVK